MSLRAFCFVVFAEFLTAAAALVVVHFYYRGM